MVKSKLYVPDKGDIVWITFNPQAGSEQAGHRPALILSPKKYNKAIGLCLACPITSKIKGFPFEVILPEDCLIQGAILSDQIKNLDWKVRNATFKCKAPIYIISDVVNLINAIIN